MNKKLYIVTVNYQAYVLADDFEAAEDFADEIVRTEDYHQVNAILADRNALGWASESLVYHDGEGDITLGGVLPLPGEEVDHD